MVGVVTEQAQVAAQASPVTIGQGIVKHQQITACAPLRRPQLEPQHTDEGPALAQPEALNVAARAGASSIVVTKMQDQARRVEGAQQAPGEEKGRQTRRVQRRPGQHSRRKRRETRKGRQPGQTAQCARLSNANPGIAARQESG